MGGFDPDFHGAKIALHLGDRIVTIRRDDRPGLLWPGLWDLPGGGREGAETPIETILREVREEISLDLPSKSIEWARPYTNSIGRQVWFFAAHLPDSFAQGIRLGNEGQELRLVAPGDFMSEPMAVPQLRDRVRDYKLRIRNRGAAR